MERRHGSLFVKMSNYLVGSTSPDTILHLTGLHQLPTDEFGHVYHSFKEDFRFPDNLELEK
jgi:ubiquinone biosynthesis protein Coq4